MVSGKACVVPLVWPIWASPSQERAESEVSLPRRVTLGRRKLDLAGVEVEQACVCIHTYTHTHTHTQAHEHTHMVRSCLHGSGVTACWGFPRCRLPRE